MLSLDVSLRPRPGLPSGRVSGVGVRRELQQPGTDWRGGPGLRAIL